MLALRVLLGAVLGAVLVKESKTIGRAYDRARATVVAAMGKLKARAKPTEAPVGDAPQPTAPAAAN